MMPAAFGPVLPATSWITVMLVYAEEKPSDFAREVPEGTRYVVKSDHRGKKIPGGCAPWTPLTVRRFAPLEYGSCETSI